MESKFAFFCIPDLTGFTRFMAENDIEFSQEVIPSILKNIVSSNILDMTVGEIEGDAVLFYRLGEVPTLQEVVVQCQNFYFNFGNHLKHIKSVYADDFHKIISSSRLGIKIIVHCGEVIFSDIGGINKMFGEDVVTAHKLLKNSVKLNEYILLSDMFLSRYSQAEIDEAFKWGKLIDGQDDYQYLALVKYKYIDLEPLYNAIEKKSKGSLNNI
jgi:hypothetical protein